MFGSFFDQGYEDKTNEAGILLVSDSEMLELYLRVLNMMFSDNVFNFVDEEDSHECHHGDGKSDGNNAFRQCQLRFVGIQMLVGILLLIGFQDFCVQAVVGTHLEEDEGGIGEKKDDRGSTTDFQDLVGNVLGRTGQSSAKDGGYNQTHYEALEAVFDEE
jgi:hypothetical protein